MRKKYYIQNLDCAHCAEKVERQLSKMKELKSVKLDFIQKTLTVETEKSDADLLPRLNSEAQKVEADVEIYAQEQEAKEKSEWLSYLPFLFGAVLFGGSFFLPQNLQPVGFLISFLLVGYKVLWKSVKNIARGQIFDENFLMCIAAIGAFCIGEYSEGVAVIIFYNIGEYFQDLAVERSRKSITDLMDIKPDYANRLTADGEKRMDPGQVHIDDVILVKPGEKVPLDGVVLEGESTLDKKALTGESVPEEAVVGSEVLSGSINLNGLLKIKVTKEFKDSTVSKILNLVENASGSKSKTEHFITKFAKIYTPAVILAAALISFLPSLFTGFEHFTSWLYRGLTFLVISCPCALVISIPLGFFGGIGGASRNGILIKGSNYLEGLNDVDTIVFDKTGTLTKGSFEVRELQCESGFTEDEVLQYAAYCESFSNHPIALSIQKAYGKEIRKNEVSSYEEIAGHGTIIVWNGKKVLAGNHKLMVKEHFSFAPVDTTDTVIYVAVDGIPAGRLLIADTIKPDTKPAIEKLRTSGIRKTVMLTGDNRKVAEAVGKEIGIDEIKSELLPQDKVRLLQEIMQKNTTGKTAFVGDGINDAPVLKTADIGIAMGGVGSDAAIEASDIVLMTDELSKIATAKAIAAKTRKVVTQNIVFALGVKALILILTIFGFGNMWGAVFADVGVALLAVLNALRCLKI